MLRHWGLTGLPIGVGEVTTNPNDTDSSTNQTLRDMVIITNASYRSTPVCHVVHSILSSLPPHPSQRALVRAMYQWVKSHVKFVEDEQLLAQMLGYDKVDKELLIYPSVVLSMSQPMGDCDDISMLLASMLRATGIKSWFVVIAADNEIPGKWSHVYVKCWLNDEGLMLPLDASHGDRIGWEYQGQVYRRMEWFVG